MTTSRHDLERRVSAPPSQVWALMADPLRLPEVHPLIEQVTIRGERVEGSSRVLEFDLLERVPVGPFRYANRYSGSALVHADQSRLTFLGRSFPWVTTHAEFELVAVGEQTVVREHFVITAPVWVHWFAARVGVEAHARQLEAIAERFARGK